MYESYVDDYGESRFFSVQEVIQEVLRNSAPPPRSGSSGPPPRRGRGRRRRRRSPAVLVHQPQYAPPMYGPPYGPPMPYYGQYPAQQPQVQEQGVDMRTALDALGSLLPAAGKLIAAYQRPPERPTLTGNPDKDVQTLLAYTADNFDHARKGAQTAGVLATAGAVMEILASL